MNTEANPPAAGSIVSIFAPGLGAVTPQQADGSIIGLPLPVNVLPIEVYVEDFGFEVPPFVNAQDVRYADRLLSKWLG